MEESISLDIPARAEYVILGRLALSGLLRGAGFSDDAVADLKLALTEACSNSVRHAYDHSDGQVHLEFSMRTDRVTVVIRDFGNGLHDDDEDCPECRGVPEIVLAEGGMGMGIIRSVVDDFDLQKPDEGGTVLRFSKFRDA